MIPASNENHLKKIWKSWCNESCLVKKKNMIVAIETVDKKKKREKFDFGLENYRDTDLSRNFVTEFF